MHLKTSKCKRVVERSLNYLLSINLPFFLERSFFWLTRVVTCRTSGSRVFSTVNVFISKFFGSHRVAIFPKASISGKIDFSKPAENYKLLFEFYFFGEFFKREFLGRF